MAYKIDEIEGIGPSNSEKLQSVGIKTTDDLLKMCCDSKGRDDASAKTGFSASQLLKWANMADLMRISGVAEEYSELLHEAGVDTVKELQHRNADNLTQALTDANEKKNLTRRVPTSGEVTKWIDQAKGMEPVITH